LQNLRGQYMEALQLLIQARDQHLPFETAVLRSKQVKARALDVATELKKLDDALIPLQLELDLENPDVGSPIKKYNIKQTSQMKQSEMVGTFTRKELKAAQKDAQQNGAVLQQTIDMLREVLKQKYSRTL
jgi:hypothetical protein